MLMNKLIGNVIMMLHFAAALDVKDAMQQAGKTCPGNLTGDDNNSYSILLDKDVLNVTISRDGSKIMHRYGAQLKRSSSDIGEIICHESHGSATNEGSICCTMKSNKLYRRNDRSDAKWIEFTSESNIKNPHSYETMVTSEDLITAFKDLFHSCANKKHLHGKGCTIPVGGMGYMSYLEEKYLGDISDSCIDKLTTRFGQYVGVVPQATCFRLFTHNNRKGWRIGYGSNFNSVSELSCNNFEIEEMEFACC